MTQCEALLNYLREFKTITPLEALTKLGIYRLSGRIFDLRNEGHRITTRTVEVPTKAGTASVAEYRLEEAAE